MALSWSRLENLKAGPKPATVPSDPSRLPFKGGRVPFLGSLGSSIIKTASSKKAQRLGPDRADPNHATKLVEADKHAKYD